MSRERLYFKRLKHLILLNETRSFKLSPIFIQAFKKLFLTFSLSLWNVKKIGHSCCLNIKRKMHSFDSKDASNEKVTDKLQMKEFGLFFEKSLKKCTKNMRQIFWNLHSSPPWSERSLHILLYNSYQIC